MTGLSTTLRSLIHQLSGRKLKSALRVFREEQTALKPREFLERYELIFAPFADKDIRLLELGINQGGSLLLWRDYFDRGIIAGLDFNPVEIVDQSGRIRVYRGLQQDVQLLDRIAADVAPKGFDIIIDDCSHVAEHTKVSFWHLYEKHLKQGGVFIIEDWGTGYYPDWPDGAAYCGQNHLAGMVGFVKELIDEIAKFDITYSANPQTAIGSRLGRMDISLGQLFIHKPVR